MNLKIERLYEDEDTLVIGKPEGVVVNRAQTTKSETIQDWVEEQMKLEPEKWTGTSELYRQRSGICHRLDKETSGCLMISKNDKALEYYLGEFKERRVKKTYIALVHGRVEPSEGEVVLPLKRSIFDREKWRVHYEGKKAATEWKVDKRYVYIGNSHFKDALTLLKINLKTGRTHQIRVHMSFLGWPIFADEKYLNRKQMLKDKELLWHHFLHAGILEFTNFKGEKVRVEASLPKDCSKLLSELVLE